MATSSFYNSSGSTPAVQNSIQTAVTQAAGSATQAATSATQATTSATNAQSSLNSFQQYYLGAYSSAPSTNQSGAMYFDTGTSQLYIWSGSSWDVTASANNLQNTDGLTEGSSNLYFTNERVDDRVNALLTAGSNVTLSYDDAANTLTIASTATASSGATTFIGLTDTPANYTGQAYRYLMVNSTEDGIATVTPSTDDISEGTSNLYYTAERVDDRVNSLLTAGNNITLTYNDAGNSLTVAAAAPGEDYINMQTTSGTQPSASGTDGMAFGKAAVVGSSASNGIAIGSSATVNGASSVSIGLNTSTSTNAGSTALGANAIANAANQLMLGAASGYVGALTSIRVGNSSYTPSNSMDLATKAYVDANSGSGTSTFTGLTDTPASMGTSGHYLAVNSGGTALEFVAAPSGGGSGIALTDLSATTAAAGTSGLAYNSSTGVFTLTPPDLSSYLTDITGQSLYNLSNVNSSASPSDGQVLAWDNANSYWTPVAASGGGSGIALTDLSATTGAAGTAALSYNSTTGVFTLTPPDLSSYLTSATLTGSDLDMGGNKVLFGNMYSAESNLPSATTYHGMFAHVHGTGKGYFAHNGNWVKLIDETSSTTNNLTEGSTNLYYTDARADARIAAADLADLTNVNNTAPTDGQVLTWDNTNSYWKPAAASGGSSINYIAHGTNADSDANPTAAGDNALSIGYGAVASGDDSISIGNSSKATGAGAVRIGYDSNTTGLPASGYGSVGLGWGANSTGTYALSLGASANATQSNTVALGASSSAQHAASVALGYFATTTATNQLRLGANNTTSGFTSIRVGNTSYTPTDNMDLATKAYVDSNSGGVDGFAENVTGTTAPTASGTDTLAIGENVAMSGNFNVGIGRNISNSANGVVAIGNGVTTDSTSTAGIVIGATAGIGNAYSVSIGVASDAGTAGDTTSSSVAVGAYSQATGLGATAVGRSATSDAENSTSLGRDADSSFSNATAIGYGAITNATNQIRLGNDSVTAVRVGTSYAESNAKDLATKGYVDTNSGGSSPAWLSADATNSSTATGSTSIAIGEGAVANATRSLAVGYGADSTAQYTVSFGHFAEAFAESSTALGYDTNISSTHANSIALGRGATTSAARQLMLGIGNTSTGLTSIRVGNTSYAPSDAMDLTTKSYVDGRNLADLSNVNNTAPTDGQVLTWDNTNSYWKPAAASSGGGGSSLPSSIGMDSNHGAANASGIFSISIGGGSEASATSAIAIGYNCEAHGTRSVSIGQECGNQGAGDQYGVAIGDRADTRGQNRYPVAIGYRAATFGFGAVCIGTGQSNSYSLAGSYGVSMGYATYANQTSCAIGGSASASGAASTAYGANTVANQTNSVAIGYQASSTTANKFVLGNGSINDLRCQDTGISAVSDRRDKTQIEALSVGLDFVNAIEPKAYYKNNRNEYYDPAYTLEQLEADDTLVQSYTFNQANYDAATEKFAKREFGFVAQEVADELPTAYSDARVSFSETDDVHGFDVQRFTPADMLPIAWKALRELSDKHDQLQTDYDALLARVVALENA